MFLKWSKHIQRFASCNTERVQFYHKQHQCQPWGQHAQFNSVSPLMVIFASYQQITKNHNFPVSSLFFLTAFLEVKQVLTTNTLTLSQCLLLVNLKSLGEKIPELWENMEFTPRHQCVLDVVTVRAWLTVLHYFYLCCFLPVRPWLCL